MSHSVGGVNITPAVNMNAEKMSDEQIDIFQRAFADIDGLEVFPYMYVGSQVVAGVLHTYIASKRPIYPGSQASLAKVVIWQHPDNVISINTITDI
ncbi:hypothetical protein [Enterobacter soli]|uniref:hypothetical protein n=1 Tax=Enterobacter soli TaxID=885040 RepID=UPI0034CD8C07